eukprot:13784792-Alexandrium_andersonii.AAC.1
MDRQRRSTRQRVAIRLASASTHACLVAPRMRFRSLRQLLRTWQLVCRARRSCCTPEDHTSWGSRREAHHRA